MEMQTLQELKRCMNCGCRSAHLKMLPVAELTDIHLKILEKWTKPQSLNGGNICFECVNLIEKCENDENPPRKVGHAMICTGCGISVLRRRYTRKCTEEELQALYPWYKHLMNYKLLCRTCCRRIEHYRKKKENPDIKDSDDKNGNTDSECATSESLQTLSDCIQNTIPATVIEYSLVVPGFKRVPGKGKVAMKCLKPDCRELGVVKISRGQRKLTFLQTNTLINYRAKLCKNHAHDNEWSYCSDHFSITQVEEALTLCEKPLSIIDFDRVDEMPEHICKYWTGLTVNEFKEIYEKLNIDSIQFNSLRNALAIHFLREKTGDSLLRIANLFMMSVKTLSNQLLHIEKCLKNVAEQ